jgi:hypothetical protein
VHMSLDANPKTRRGPSRNLYERRLVQAQVAQGPLSTKGGSVEAWAYFGLKEEACCLHNTLSHGSTVPLTGNTRVIALWKRCRIETPFRRPWPWSTGGWQSRHLQTQACSTSAGKPTWKPTSYLQRGGTGCIMCTKSDSRQMRLWAHNRGCLVSPGLPVPRACWRAWPCICIHRILVVVLQSTQQSRAGHRNLDIIGISENAYD